MKHNLTFIKQMAAIGCLFCGVVISGVAIGYTVRQIEERLLPQLMVSFNQQKQPAIAIELTQSEAVDSETEPFSTMPPPPDMGAIFAAQKAGDYIIEEPYESAEIDFVTTAAIPAPDSPFNDITSSEPIEDNVLVAHAKPQSELTLNDLPIPTVSPRKNILKTGPATIKKLRTARKGTPDVLVLGDSQISVSAGPSYQKFFSNLPAICNVNESPASAASDIDFTQTASLGVRSTSLHSWVARSGAAKGSICDVDKKWGVNAGAWGIGGHSKRKYIQIGKGKDYKFCKPKTSAFESMFAKGYYNPKLLVMAFLGNSADRWARSKKNALRDVNATLEQIPEDTACIFMTSAPVYSKRVNDMRVKAQKNIAEAFRETGNRCAVVEGITPKVRSEIEGNKAYFRKTKSGKIADKFHPNANAIKKFVKYNTPALCRAVHKQLG